MDAPDIASIKTALDAASSWNEWATGAVTLGVAVELLALLVWGKEMPRSEKIALAFGSVLVVIGVGGEWVFGGRTAAAATALQQASDERIAALGKDQARDHKIAAEAAAYAASLGVSVKSLQVFVANQEARNNAAIAELRSSTAGLNKARSDALAAAERSEADLKLLGTALAAQRALTEKIEHLTARRTLTGEQSLAMVADLRKFPVGGILIIPQWSDPEVVDLASQIEEIMDGLKGGGPDDGVMMLPGVNKPGFPDGVTIQFMAGNEVGRKFASEVARLLVGAKIGAHSEATLLDATKNDPADPKFSSVTIIVGNPP